MRASTAWLLATVLLLLAALGAHNLALRDEYQRRLRAAGPDAYVTLGFKNFSEVVLPDSGNLSVQISQGPFQVRVRSPYAQALHLRQKGAQLFVAADSLDALEDDGMLLISCPRLVRVSTRLVAGPPSRARARYGEDRCNVQIEGFRGGGLTLEQARRSRIVLNENNLGSLQATVGYGPASCAALELSADNHIETASLTVNGTSELSVYRMTIPKLRYKYSDSAVLQLPGSMVPRLAAGR